MTDSIRDGLFNRDGITSPDDFWQQLTSTPGGGVSDDDLDAVLATPLDDPTDQDFWDRLTAATAAAPPPLMAESHLGSLHHRRPGAPPEADAYRVAYNQFRKARQHCLRRTFGSPERTSAITAALEAEAALQAARVVVRQLGYNLHTDIDSSDAANPRNRWRWGP